MPEGARDTFLQSLRFTEWVTHILPAVWQAANGKIMCRDHTPNFPSVSSSLA